MAFAMSVRVRHCRRFSKSTCMRPQNDSALRKIFVLLLQLLGPLPRRSEFRGPGLAGRGLQPAVNQILPLPAVQARLSDPEQPGDLGHRPARPDKL